MSANATLNQGAETREEADEKIRVNKTAAQELQLVYLAMSNSKKKQNADQTGV